MTRNVLNDERTDKRKSFGEKKSEGKATRGSSFFVAIFVSTGSFLLVFLLLLLLAVLS